jgi:hypothetical protein
MFSIRNQKNERKKMKLDLISETKRVDSISNQKDRNKGFRFDSNRKNKIITLTLGDKGAAGLTGARRRRRRRRPWPHSKPVRGAASSARQYRWAGKKSEHYQGSPAHCLIAVAHIGRRC